MDRTSLAACAVTFLPLCVVMTGGCGSSESAPESRLAPPQVLRVAAGGHEDAQPLQPRVVAASALDRSSEPATSPVDDTAADEMNAEIRKAEQQLTRQEAPRPARRPQPTREKAERPSDSEGAYEAEQASDEPAEIRLADAPVELADESNDNDSNLEHTRLPWADATPRSSEMIAVVQRADARVRHGFRLAERGATFSAKAEFVAALQLIAQANDVQQATRMYTKALTAGLTALRESSDFMRQQTGGVEVDVARKVTGHKTPVLKGEDIEECSTMQAAQRYYTYAQEQLAAAAGQEQCGSMALYGLGKVTTGAAGSHPGRQLESTAEGMVYHQAALLADSTNFRAANELAVLLADAGAYARARDLLAHSVTLSPQAATWQNLAVVHAHLGERERAAQASVQAQALRQITGTPEGPSVVWLDNDSFARSAPPQEHLPAPIAPAGAPAGQNNQGKQTDKPATSTAKRMFDWLPKNPLR